MYSVCLLLLRKRHSSFLSLYFKCCTLLMWSKNYFFSTERQRLQPLAI